jgi:general secretion pathway protein K
MTDLRRRIGNNQKHTTPLSTGQQSSLKARGAHNYGFALIIVLWYIVLISFITAHIVASGRTELQIVNNRLANAMAREAADGAIFEAIFRQSAMGSDEWWPADGSVHEIAVGDSRVSVRLEDESWWINPNSASPVLVEALLRATGSDPASASRIAIAISEWVGSGAFTLSATNPSSPYG